MFNGEVALNGEKEASYTHSNWFIRQVAGCFKCKNGSDGVVLAGWLAEWLAAWLQMTELWVDCHSVNCFIQYFPTLHPFMAQ